LNYGGNLVYYTAKNRLDGGFLL